MRFEAFQDGLHGNHLEYWNRAILVILNLYVTLMPPIQFQLNRTYGLGNVVWRIIRCLLWWPSWILEWTISVVLNLHVSPMPPTKFQLNLTYRSGADVVSTFSRWPQWQPSWILERNEFSNSKSPLPSPHPHPNASHQVWAQSDLWFMSRCGLKIFKKPTVVAILYIIKKRF